MICPFRKFQTDNNNDNSKILIQNSKLIRRMIEVERKKRLKHRQTILGLRQQVNYFKKKLQRREFSFKKNNQNALENTGLDVRKRCFFCTNIQMK